MGVIFIPNSMFPSGAHQRTPTVLISDKPNKEVTFEFRGALVLVHGAECVAVGFSFRTRLVDFVLFLSFIAYIRKADMSNIAVFQNVFGHSPVVRVFCPGRVNLIGEHIDYHGYGVFPIATEEGTETLAAPNGKGIIRIANVNEQYPEHTVSLPFEWSGASPPKWYDYVLCGWKGVMERLNCDQIGFDLLVEGSIPPSSGLSSSSSLVCSAALTAWMIHTKETFESIRKEDLADLCAIAEHYVGTHGGGMDQAAEVLAVKGSALRIDFFPLKSRVISLPPLASFVVLHCGEALNKAATSHYNERVSEGRLAGKLLLKNHGTGTNPRSWRLKDVQEALGKTLEEMLELCECLPVEAPREQLEDLLTKEVVAECLTSNTQHCPILRPPQFDFPTFVM
ncbi:hypothetical protein RB195_006391 [Necator americanus]|uniref:Galactokinase n=1 Tax=Necator americanus TaxID=51031 RepID=A0ABR1BW71_NECAM